MEEDNTEKLIDLEEKLYDGNKEEIEKILNDYKVSFNYSIEIRGFSWESNKLNIICRGYKSHYVPNCVKYFGNKYEYKEKIDKSE